MENTDKKISIIIPAANEERYIERCLKSIKAQTVQPLETIVVVNGGKDNTKGISERYAEKVLFFDHKLGYSVARNTGAAAARGNILLFLDADSMMEPQTLEKISEKYKENMYGTVLGRPDTRKIKYAVFFFLKNAVHRLRIYNGVLGGLMFCDAVLFKKLGGYDISKAIDEIYDFSRRARRAGGKYVLVTSTYATTSMRRFERFGFMRMLAFWIETRMRYLSGWRLRPYRDL